jgi:MFS transporter, DHA2 family, multidrug resistance protein
LEAGFWTAPSAGGFIAGSILAPVIVRLVRPAYVVAGGLVLTAAGLALLAQLEAESSVALVVAETVVIALGIAPPVTLATDLIVGCVPPERAGVAAGISETGAELGGALGVAVLGSIGVAVYRSQVADGVPAGVPTAAPETAKDTLGGATHAVEGLPGELGTSLLDAARKLSHRACGLRQRSPLSPRSERPSSLRSFFGEQARDHRKKSPSHRRPRHPSSRSAAKASGFTPGP